MVRIGIGLAILVGLLLTSGCAVDRIAVSANLKGYPIQLEFNYGSRK